MACIQWQTQTCETQEGGTYYSTSTLDVFPGCTVGSCCKPLPPIINSGTVSQLVILVQNDCNPLPSYVCLTLQLQVQQIQVYGYKRTATTPPTSFQALLVSRGL